MAAIVSKSDHENLWQDVQNLLKERMSQPSFETWIGPLSFSELNGSVVTLHAQSSFNRDWILKNYRQPLQEAFEAVLTQPVEVRVQESRHVSMQEEALVPREALPEKMSRPWTPRTTQSNLNPKYVFEHFVVGQHNRFCHAAALAVAEAPAKTYNPYFVYGGVGLGKTHIIQAIGHYILSHTPDMQVKYITAEQFTNDLIAAIGNRSMTQFRDRYRKIDVLIIDDIQFLEGKERTQEEIFHTFNALHQAGKQIILSSDRPPKHLSGLEDRLRSRFEWGLIADIQPADVETRISILRKKAEREKLEIAEEVLTYIAETHPNNIRELEGALNKVAAYAMLTRTALDLPAVQSILGLRADPATMSHERILDTVAKYFHLRLSDLKSSSRAKDISHARQVGIYILRTMTEASFPKIGDILGGRKHTTILYAYEKVKELLAVHPVLNQQIQEITNRIQSQTF